MAAAAIVPTALYSVKCDKANDCAYCPKHGDSKYGCSTSPKNVSYQFCEHCKESLTDCVCFPCNGCGYTMCDCVVDSNGYTLACKKCGWKRCACRHKVDFSFRCNQCNHYTCSCVKCRVCTSICNDKGECPKCDSPSP